MSRSIFLPLVLLGVHLSIPAAAEPWSDPQVIATESPGSLFMAPNLLVDGNGTLNVIWLCGSRTGGDRILLSRLVDGTWTEPVTIYSSPSSIFRLVSALSESGVYWIAWHAPEGNGRSIHVMHGTPGNWSQPEAIPQPATTYNFAPKLAVRGDIVWVAWYTEWNLMGPAALHDSPSSLSGELIRAAGSFAPLRTATDSDLAGSLRSAETDNPSDVCVCRWDGSHWGEYRILTAQIAGDHWFTNIAADSKGDAHVVWGNSQGYVYCYSKSHDGISWSPAFTLNPLLLGVAAAGWPGCSIAIDALDHPHVAWTGARIDETSHLEDWDIFYSKFDGQYWTSPLQVNDEDDDTDAYPEITLQGTSDVWITWLDGNPASLDPYHVGAARASQGPTFPAWTSWRLDDDTYMYDSDAMVTVDLENDVWVIWQADPPLYETVPPGVILARRYEGSVPVRLTNLVAIGLENSVELRWTCEPGVFSMFLIERSSTLGWETRSRITAQLENYVWVDRDVAPGVTYMYRITAVTRSGREEHYGPIEAATGEAPDHLVIRGAASRDGAIHVLIGIDHPAPLDLTLCDVQGRRVDAGRYEPVAAGWQEVTWTPRHAGSGGAPASGVYWLKVSSGGEEDAVRVLVTH